MTDSRACGDGMEELTELRKKLKQLAWNPYRPLIYLASPYTASTLTVRVANVEVQMAAAERLVAAGFEYFAPLVMGHFHDSYYEHDYGFWISRCLAWLSRCDGLLRLPGESSGADLEVAYANEIDIPVFFSLPSLIKNQYRLRTLKDVEMTLFQRSSSAL
jgi:hypothetical protein